MRDRLGASLATAMLLVLAVGAELALGAGPATVIVEGASKPIPWDTNPTLTVRLLSVGGAPLADQRLVATLGADVREHRTDASGNASFRFAKVSRPGTYTVQVVFKGTSQYGASTAYFALTVQSPELVVQSVPPLKGVQFRIGQKIFVSGADGIARIGIQPSQIGARPDPITSRLANGSEARFSRWFGSGQSVLRATWDVYYPVSLRFVDLANRRVDPSKISSVTIKNSIGERMELTKLGPMWVQGSRVVPLSGGLESKDLYFTIESVMVEGTNVVNRSQQRFVPAEVRDWAVTLLFYDAKVAVRDAFFRFPTGSSVVLAFPDGQSKEYLLKPDGTADLTSLPRGDYQIRVKGMGMSFSRPLALSRDQTVDLELISYLDLALAAMAGLGIFFGLLFVGRPQLMTVLGRWRHPAVALDRIAKAVMTGLAIAAVIELGPPMVRTYISIFDGASAADQGVQGTTSSSARGGVPTATSKPAPKARSYVVRAGDTLRAIAVKLYGSEERWRDLYAANRATLPNPDTLRAGQTLVVPSP